SPQMRFHALTMLRKSLENAKKALTDTLIKDIIKNMKHGISDKALPVQRAAARVLITMFSLEESVSLSDAESVVALCMKTLDNSDQTTRQALAHLVGHVLAATQMARPVPAPEQQKGKKDVENADASTPAYVVSEHLKPLLAPGEMLSQLSSHFNKANLSRRARAGIFDFYFALLTKLGTEFVENNYALIVGHLMLEVVSHPKNNVTRYDRLFTRKVVGALLRDLIAVRMLSEQGQIAVLQELSASYLRRWPALMPGQVAPSSDVLTVALTETAELLQMLGNAPPVVQDAVAEPLLTLLSHPSHSVRINASWALKYFCSSTPLCLPKTILSIMESLHRDIESLQSPAAPSDIDRRALGRAYGLAALVSTIPDRPLYVSFDIATNVLDMATQLLKRAVEHDVRIAGVEVEVAWILIASLMLLGPNFVRSHLSQLLVLWRNALPKTSNKDNSPGRPANEWEFLLHVRESALGAILCFLLHNSPLITLDVARRISSMLNNALAFTNAFASQITEEPVLPSTEAKGPTLRTRECLLRCRVYQCFTALGTSSLTESAQSSLLQSTLTVFAGPEGDGMSVIQASIASSSGFTSVWQTADGFGYGVTTIDIADDDTECLLGTQTTRLTNEQVEELTTLLLHKPVLGAREHDTLSLCLPGASGSDSLWFDPPPPPTAVVNAAIELFARLLPSQDLTTTTRLVTQLTELVKSPKLDRNAGRKAAVVVNAAVATVQTLRYATTTHYRQARETLGHLQVTTALTGFLKDTLVDGDPLLRRASSEVIGRLANISGTTFLTNQAKVLVDHIVSNRDPQGRAGCALAFGELYSHVGGLAAAPILKTTVNILMSLSNDPHPLVHYWSLTALAKVINAASLAFTPFVPSTLGMLVKIYMAEAHETEGGTLNNANLSGDLQAFPIVCRIIDAIITILGPDVDESSRTRSLVLDLVREFSFEEDEDILVEAIKCTQHLLMFASTHVDIPDAVFRFRSHLASNRRQLKLAAIDALYQLVQKDALVMSRLGGDGLVEDLFAMLDGDPGIQGVRSVIKSWLSQTAVHNPSAWIDLCLRIMLRTNAPQKTVDAAANLDDEGQSLNISTTVGNVAQEGPSTASTSRWRTQLFALECLHEICIAVAQSARREHTDVLFAKNRGLSVHGLLVSRIPDLIKMAFTASAAYVTEIRLEGLVVLSDVIQAKFFNLCHRIVMVENAATIVHLLAVVRAFCKHFGHLGIEGVAVPNEVLPADSVRAQCLKLCAYVLRHVTHSLEAPAITGSIQELAKMIGGALSNFELVATTTAGNIREDVRGIGCVLYADLLKDETLDMDLITPTLPAFKALLSVEAKESTRNRYDQLIHGLVSSCLLNIDDMRGREGSVCTRKVNTNMLAAVVILTSIPPRVKIANGVVEHLAHLICQKLEESDDMAMIAVHCTKTLTVAAAGSDLLRSCSRQLLPALVQYVARLSPRVDDDTLSDQQRAAIEEVYKAFTALLSLVTGQNRTRMLCIILPTITLLLRPSLLPAPSIHSSAVSQLLTLAASSPTSFKEAAAQLDPKVREVLELSIRKAVEGTPAAAQSAAKPQISLRSF
ncbi:hypothetical protein PISMIDRAFT_97684, partial [Pisolithus microcarpus 441]